MTQGMTGSGPQHTEENAGMQEKGGAERLTSSSQAAEQASNVSTFGKWMSMYVLAQQQVRFWQAVFRHVCLAELGKAQAKSAGRACE